MSDPRLRHVFDRVSIGMVALAEQTGQLTKIMAKLADLKERQLNLSRSLISALTYPGVLFCVIVLMGLLFTTILGPGEEGLFAAFGAEIPWPTRVVQKISAFVRSPWLIAGLAAAFFLIAWAFREQMRTSPSFRLRVHVLLATIPVLGPLLHKIECAKILYVLSDGMDVGIPAVQVLAIARDVCANEKVKVELSGVVRAFADGSDLNEALALYPIFPRMALSMVEVGMESGKLDKVLQQASLGFEEDVQMALDNVARLAEPLLLAFAGLMAGFLAIATLLPIINMVQNI